MSEPAASRPGERAAVDLLRERFGIASGLGVGYGGRPRRLLELGASEDARRALRDDHAVELVSCDPEALAGADGAEPLFGEETFDLVLWLGDAARSPAEQIARLLRPDGSLLAGPLARSSPRLAERLSAAGLEVETIADARASLLLARRRPASARAEPDRASPPVEAPERSRRFIRTVSPADRSARPRTLRRYYGIGLEALRLVEDGIAEAGAPPPNRILDLPCGYGRVTRMLRMGFPDASLTVCDHNPQAISFCRAKFGADPVLAESLGEDIPGLGTYELIWCGSLLTRLDHDDAAGLLSTLGRHLAPRGTLVFTTQGRKVAGLLASGRMSPAIRPGTTRPMLRRFQAEGFAFEAADLTHEPQEIEDDSPVRGLGLALCSPEWVTETLLGAGELELVTTHEAGWDDRQDVFVCRPRREPLPA